MEYMPYIIFYGITITISFFISVLVLTSKTDSINILKSEIKWLRSELEIYRDQSNESFNISSDISSIYKRLTELETAKEEIK